MEKLPDCMSLGEPSAVILDCAMHMPLYTFEDLKETLLLLRHQDTSTFEKEWERLTSLSVLVQKDGRWVVNDSFAGVKDAIQAYHVSQNISFDTLRDSLSKLLADKPDNTVMVIRAMGRVYDKSIVFSDYDWDSNVIAFCDGLVRERILFRRSTSSRKHSYRNYYLRSSPFDCHKLLTDLILQQLNVSGLKENDWLLLAMLMLSQFQQVDYQHIGKNLQLTEVESREMINELKNRGLLEERVPTVSLQKALQGTLGQYFAVQVYPYIRTRRLESMKLRITKSISNLWLFTNVKRILELPVGLARNEPIPAKLVRKSEIKQFEDQFPDMCQIGLIFDLGDDVVILSDLVRDGENWLRGSIHKSLVLIPAHDPFMAKRILQDMFSKCEDYVKVQDPYLGEETFHVLEYLPKHLEVRLLTGLTLGIGEDTERLRQLIQRWKGERKFRVAFIGDPTSGEAPFHDRFILSKNRCWSVGTSLKQLGVGKDSTIDEISKSDKDEIIEPAFGRWWTAKEKELAERGLIRLDFAGWLEFVRKLSS